MRKKPYKDPRKELCRAIWETVKRFEKTYQVKVDSVHVSGTETSVTWSPFVHSEMIAIKSKSKWNI